MTDKDEFKMAIVIRKDLKMGCGKIAGQASHATMMAYSTQIKNDNTKNEAWFSDNQPKIILKVRSEQKIEEIEEMCKEKMVNYSLVRDAGRTQIPGGTLTAIGIGPDKKSVVDEIIGDLKLL